MENSIATQGSQSFSKIIGEYESEVFTVYVTGREPILVSKESATKLCDALSSLGNQQFLGVVDTSEAPHMVKASHVGSISPVIPEINFAR